MVPTEIRTAIIDILADIAPDEDLSNLNDDKSFRDQMELDSMDFLDIVMEPVSYTHLTLPTTPYV